MGLIYFIAFWGVIAVCLGIALAIHVHKENNEANI